MALIVLLTCSDAADIICGKLSLVQQEIYNIHSNLKSNNYEIETNKLDNFFFRAFIQNKINPSSSSELDLNKFRNELTTIIKFLKNRLNKGVPIYKNKNYKQKKLNGDKYFSLLLAEYGSVNSLMSEIKLRYKEEWNSTIKNELNLLNQKKNENYLKAITEYRELVEKQFKINFENNGGIKGLNISIRNYSNLRRTLLGIQNNQKSYIYHPKFGNLPMINFPGARNCEKKTNEKIIKITSSDLNDTEYLIYLEKKLNNIGKNFKFPLFIDIETQDQDDYTLTEQEKQLYLPLLNLSSDMLQKEFENNYSYWTIKKLQNLLKCFKLKVSAPRKADLIERIVRNLPIINKYGSFENDRAFISWKKIKTQIGYSLIRYRSMRMELISLIKNLVDNKLFQDKNFFNIGIRFYGDGGTSCSISFIAKYIGIIWDENIFKFDITKQEIRKIMKLKLWLLTIGSETKELISITEQIKGEQILSILLKRFIYKGIIKFIILLLF